MLDPLRFENEVLRARVARLTEEVERLKRLVGAADRLWRVEDVARYLGVHERTVYRLPVRYLKIGGARRYDPADVRQYLEQEATDRRRRMGNVPPAR